MSQQTSLLDLPVDILLLVFPHLDARSFLCLTSTCKTLRQSSFLNESTYWSSLVRNTFRVANQPVVQHDGERWHKLFKRLRTQTRVYTWGDNSHSCLGLPIRRPELQALGQRRGLLRRHVGWPQEIPETNDLGIISDMQCGGWSTSFLTSKGSIYATGILDGLLGGQHPHETPTALRYPRAYPDPTERYDPATAAKQFSHGRQHLLALSDSGKIWSWQNLDQAALNVRFIHHDLVEDRAMGRGVVQKVIAGWSKSAALVEEIGIVVWDPLQRGADDSEIEDAALVLESAVVPSTGYKASTHSTTSLSSDDQMAHSLGEVLNFVVLEGVIIFNTSLGKVFVSRITWNEHEQVLAYPVELPLPFSPDDVSPYATDTQGSFRSFAIFTKAGQVLTSTQDSVMSYLTSPSAATYDDTLPSDSMFDRIPALQNAKVIALAFGDYHFHALHSPGYITSYGKEPGSCGALGLGGPGNPEARLRGIRNQGFNGHGQPIVRGDGQLVPHAYTRGRQVWFEKEKRDWIAFLTSGGVDPGEAVDRIRMAIGSPDIHGQGEVSEWIEQEGRDWEDKYDVRQEEDDGLPAYFALNVAAAGWHSGALILVNQSLAERITNAVEVSESSSESSGTTQPAESADPESATTGSKRAPFHVSLFEQALDWSRWFLGMFPYNVVSSTTQRPSSNAPARQGLSEATNRPPSASDSRRDPVQYGAAPRVGVSYVWSNDRFPRLRLSDGTEMPGSDSFDDWRYGRPQWDLNVRLT